MGKLNYRNVAILISLIAIWWHMTTEEYIEHITEVPIVDISELVKGTNKEGMNQCANEINHALRTLGFFYISNHGISEELQSRLVTLSKSFFSLPLSVKESISMDKGGRAWRGYFPIGQELTSGIPDIKEGIYFGTPLNDDHELVSNHTPMHVPNIFIHDENIYSNAIEFQDIVTEYIDKMTLLGHTVMKGISLSLDLPSDYFYNAFTNEPTILFRIFNYPPLKPTDDRSTRRWGVGEHTDYGFLTLLKQDHHGGLQVRNLNNEWLNAPPISNTFVVNIGDMLDTLTNGYYLSTPHRVRAHSADYDRLSFPLFFDPNYFSVMKPIREGGDQMKKRGRRRSVRWDGHDLVSESVGRSYGDYLLAKVKKVFPQLVV